MSLMAFSMAERPLHVKRRNFSKDMKAILNKARSEACLNMVVFDEKKIYFEEHWEEIVTSTEGCINLIDDGDDDKDEQTNDLNYQMDILKMQKEQFLNLGVEIERIALNIDVKNVIVAVIEPSEGGRVLTTNDLVYSISISSFTESFRTATTKEVKKLLHVYYENDENSSESSIEDDNVKDENITLSLSTSQDTDKLDRNILFDKIGELFNSKITV